MHVEIPATDSRVGDVIVNYRYSDIHDAFPDRGGYRITVTAIVGCTIHGEGSTPYSSGTWASWGQTDERALVILVERQDYANPETAKRLRDYLTATCHLDL